MRRTVEFVLAGAALLLAAAAALADSSVQVPPVLHEWEPWVLHDHPSHRCPWLAPGNPADDSQHVCAWPGPLELSVDAQGGRFSQHWRVDAESWVALAGDAIHWPEHVTVDGAPAALVDRDGVPSLRLGTGTHAVTGEFRWSQRPEVLPVPAAVGLVTLIVGGTRVAAPQRSPQGLFLGRRAAAREEDRLDVRVFRKLTDDQPSRLLTRLTLSVAGEAREIRLPDVLPQGFVPSAIDSTLAARLDPDHALRIQVRPGRFTVDVDARGPSPVAAVTGAARPAPWPAQEIWSFASVDRLRVAAVEGVPSVDPSVADVPEDWRALPTYVVAPGATLRLAERSRGLTATDGNQLRLARRIWLDFSGDAYTVEDQIAGTMRHDWRLDLAAPYALQSARTGDTPLLVTQGSAASTAGVEWRAPKVAATTVARVPRGLGALPATGWQQRFAAVSGTLMLAPAYRLIAAIGPDAAPGAWIERWHLLDIFVVLLTTVTAWRLYGWRVATLALAALTLTHHEPGAPTWLWLNALAALALVHSAPEGKPLRVASVYRLLALGAVALVLVPFTINQVRLAVYPQLEVPRVQPPMLAQMVAPEPEPPMDLKLAAPPPPPAAMAPRNAGEPVSAARSVKAEAELEEAIIMSRSRAAEYEPGAVTQSGPGLPNWRYSVYPFSWSGPVEARETVRFVVSPPWLTRLWRVAGAGLSVLLLAMLGRALRRGAGGGEHEGAMLAAVLLAAGLTLTVTPDAARASTTPDPEILRQLGQRLLAPPACQSSCIDIATGSVEAGSGRLTVVLNASALDTVGLALPAGDPDWVVERVDVDGVAAAGLYRGGGGRRYVPLAPGHHVIRIEGAIADVDALSVRFPVRPHVLDVTPGPWDVAGVADRRLLADALELSRRRVVASSSTVATSKAEFPPYVIVERNIRLGHDWLVDTRVRRVAPAGGAFTAKVPLLAAESPVTADLALANRVASIGFAATDAERSFASTLPPSGTLELVASRDPAFGEVWRFEVAASWHAEFSGIPAIHPAGASDGEAAEGSDTAEDGTWRFEYAPRAGERLVVHVTRPPAVEGGTIAFDHVELATSVGSRARSAGLELRYRSTQGGRELLHVPTAARVTAVTVDGDALGVRPEGGALSLPVLPGEHSVKIAWDEAEGTGWLTRTAAVDVGAPASNLEFALTVPEDRWVLYAWGPGLGPAVLYWGELLVFLVVAFAAGRSGRTPLQSREWLLLGLGLSTYSWTALALFAAFVATFEWRGRSGVTPATGRDYNAMQVGLALLAIVAIASLVAAVPYSLLSTPDMRISGSYEAPGTFHWFSDQTASAVPVVSVLSVPLWWYKLAMLAWALWLSFVLTRWIRWAWDIYRRDGLWHPHTPATAAPAAGSPAPPAASASRVDPDGERAS
jgi:hypothetical protein